VTLFLILVGLFLILYILILVIMMRGLSKTASFDQTGAEKNFISIVISVHNEAHNLPGLIVALSAQDYPENFWEIIIVNDRSTDQTKDLLEEYASKDKKIKIIHIEKIPSDYAPKKYAIDRAIENSSGSLILLTDADGRPGPAWIRTMSSRFSHHTGMVIGYAPYIINSPYHNFTYKLLALEYMSHACIAAATTGLGYPVTCVGTNLSYRKSVYTDLKGFGKYKNYHSGDDDLFMQRIRDETQWKITYAYNPASHVYNAPPLSWLQFFNQRLRYASKGFFYPKKITTILLFYFFLNAFMLLLLIHALFDNQILLFFCCVFSIKSFSEFILLYKFAILTEQKKLLKYFFPTILLHIPYIILFGLLGSFKKYRWAGRYK
jgi:cellulose synthase/poly-beta-1,6-N-acetylglucosamine synthase-like glycosyltransferase